MLHLFKKNPCILNKGLNVLAKIIWLEIRLMKKNNFPQILPEKKLILKNKNKSKDIEYITKVSLHPREGLKRKKIIKQEPEIQY